MSNIKAIIEGIVSQAKPVGSGGSAFRTSSSSGSKGRDHGIDVGAHRNYDHEVRAKKQTLDSAEKREREVEKRNREAEQRQKETMKMAKEETVTEAKKFVFDKPHPTMVKAYDKRDTPELHGMHKRWSADHSNPKNNPETSEKLLAVHHVLKSRGETVSDLPKHKNLGLQMHEETNTEKRMAIKNVARPDDAAPTSEKSTLAKTGEIKTKITEDKPAMSVPNFGLPQSLINAARQIVEKKHDDSAVDAKKMTGGKTAVDTDPETNDAPDDSDDKPAKKSHTVPKTDKEKKLAALASPKNKITHKDVMVGRGVVKEEDNNDLQEISTLKKFVYNFKAGKSMHKALKKADAAGDDIENIDKHKDIYNTARKRKEGIARVGRLADRDRAKKGVKEEVEFSVEEIERIEAIAAQLDEAKPTIVSSPIRGANQDQSGFGTKGDTADYTISDSKKMKKEELSSKEKMKRGMYNKEEVELDEARGRPRKNPLPAGKEAEEGDDTHKHPMQQLEKIAHAIVGSEPHFEHKDGTKTNVGKHLARHMVVLHNSMKTTQEKNDFADKLHANRDSMRSTMTKHF